MSDIAIRVDNLGKQYWLGQTHRRGDTLRDSLAGLLGSLRSEVNKEQEEMIWAVKDVSFDVKHGEVVGLIGHNGAGKSTLLKLLTRITEPTIGRAEIHGRVGSLLEVGTGFHEELTGRENIYLSGAILGMRRAEIDRKLDEIIDFSGIEKFIDTPVKRYSSGMKVRLGFAVAAHLEPEILLVDEVLAVGDVAFQEKCLAKMQSVSGEGRTVLLVSHNMTSILNLCRRSLLFSQGMLIVDGESENVVREYLTTHNQPNQFAPDHAVESGGELVRITHLSVNPKHPRTGECIEFIIGASAVASSAIACDVSIAVLSDQGSRILQFHSGHMGTSIQVSRAERQYSVKINSLPLVAGDYRVNIWLGSGERPLHWLQNCLLLRVEPGKIGDTYVENRGYPVVVPSEWTELDR